MSFHQDLDNMTRDMHEASLEVEYMKKTPVLSLILEQKNQKFNGGKQYYFEVDTDTTEDLAQDYSVNDVLTHGTEDTTERVTFTRKHFQVPVQLDLDEELQNALDNEDGTKLHDLAAFKVKKTNEAGRLHLRKLIYGSASDSAKQIQGLNSALTVDATYGQVTRTNASSIADWWQPNDNQNTAVEQATSTTFSITWLQGVWDKLQDLEAAGASVILGNTLWLALKAEAHAKSMPIEVNKDMKFKYGIEDINIEGMRVIKDPFLQTKYNTAMSQTTGAAGSLDRRVYIFNAADWKLMTHPRRNFKMTEFFDQKKIANGSDFELARLLYAGNLCCTHPNRSAYYSNVVP